MGQDFWTEERISILKDMWPSFSGKIIAERLGSSRNAVIAKAKRLGLKKEQLAKIAVVKPPTPRKRKPKPSEPRVRRVEPTVVGSGFPGNRRCQWPGVGLDDGPCDAPSVPDRPYCEEHCRRAYVKPRDPREQRPHRVYRALKCLLIMLVCSGHGEYAWIEGYTNKLGQSCCGKYDCASVDGALVRESRAGFHVLDKKRMLFVPRGEAHVSEDGRYWRCVYPDGRTRCFFYPLRGL